MRELTTCSQSQHTVQSMASAHWGVSAACWLNASPIMTVSSGTRSVSKRLIPLSGLASRTWRRPFPCNCYCSCDCDIRLLQLASCLMHVVTCTLQVLTFIVVVIDKIYLFIIKIVQMVVFFCHRNVPAWPREPSIRNLLESRLQRSVGRSSVLGYRRSAARSFYLLTNSETLPPHSLACCSSVLLLNVSDVSCSGEARARSQALTRL